MKVQINVDEQLWRSARVAALTSGESMGEFVGRCLKKMMSGSARMNSEVTGKSERDRQMEESPPEKVNPSNQLKEDHGWCKVCGVRQVKLPGLLCKECGK